MVLEAGSPRSQLSLRRAPFLVCRSNFFPVFSHGLSLVHKQRKRDLLSLLIKPPVLLDYDPTFMISFNFNYLPKALSRNTDTLRDRASINLVETQFDIQQVACYVRCQLQLLCTIGLGLIRIHSTSFDLSIYLSQAFFFQISPGSFICNSCFIKLFLRGQMPISSI